MRKSVAILAAMISVICVSSCLKGSSTYQYTTALNFEYPNAKDTAIFVNGATCLFHKEAFYYGEFAFNTVTAKDDSTKFLAGFAYAYLKDTTTVLKEGQDLPDPFVVFDCDSLTKKNHFMCYRKSAVAENNPKEGISFIWTEDGKCDPKLVFVAPTHNNVIRAASEFSNSDWARVVFTSYRGTQKVGSVEADLFKKGKPVETWTKVALEGLGEDITSIAIDFDASKDGVVDAVCLDYLVAEIKIEYK